MLGPKRGLKDLKRLDQASGEVAPGTEGWQIAVGKAGKEKPSPLQTPRERDSSSSSSSTNSTFDPTAHEQEWIHTGESPAERDVDPVGAAPAPLFPGYAEMGFSTPEKRYFYKLKGLPSVGGGTFAVAKEVYWYNPGKGELEPRIAKSLRLELAETHEGGMSGWRAEADHEVKALRTVAGVHGAVSFLDMIEEASGAIHIILERVDAINLTTRLTCRDWELGLTWLQIRLALKHLAQVLAECHRRGLVHGDVKPENILSLQDKSGITLVDFGSASLWTGSCWHCMGGTISYTAPEVISFARSQPAGGKLRGGPVYGPLVDSWAYGLTAFTLLTGRPLFECGKRPTSSDAGSGSANSKDAGSGSANPKDRVDWGTRSIADLHADWEDVSESRPIHATFRVEVQQLAGASEEFQREGVDFLRGLIDPDPSTRMTVENALQHPFLVNAFNSVLPDSYPPKIVEEKSTPDTTLHRHLHDACLKMLEKAVADLMGE